MNALSRNRRHLAENNLKSSYQICDICYQSTTPKRHFTPKQNSTKSHGLLMSKAKCFTWLDAYLFLSYDETFRKIFSIYHCDHNQTNVSISHYPNWVPFLLEHWLLWSIPTTLRRFLRLSTAITWHSRKSHYPHSTDFCWTSYKILTVWQVIVNQ